MASGWIKLHRQLLNSLIFGNEKGLKVWIWCLLKATHTDFDFLIGRTKVHLKAGQFIMGSNTAKEELQLARSTVWYWLNFLEKEGQVVLQKNAKYTVVTIPKWEEYQHDLDADETLAKRKVDTYKNEKNMKNNTSEKTFLPGKQEYEIVEEDAKPKRERIVPTSPSSVVDKWNSYPNWKALKRVGTPPNPSAVEKLLPTARNTMDIRGAIIRKRTKYTEAEFNTAIENYVLEILNRKQDKSTYYAHRFTLYEFLVNKDVFEKYVNR